MDYPVPQSPYDNPPLADGTYDAIVNNVIEGRYGDDKPYLKVILELPTVRKAFVTNMYFSGGTGHTPQRFWHFCQCLDRRPADFFTAPQDFCGQELRILVHRVAKPTVNWGRPYVDVKRFLPPGGATKVATEDNCPDSPEVHRVHGV